MPKERIENSLGSGVIISKKGLIVTNNHVIENASKIKVVLSDKREYNATVLLKDKSTDLAILTIQDPNQEVDFPFSILGDSNAIEVGDIVLAIGNPFGVGQTVTSGIISAVARSKININSFDFFIQTDAAINPGNSGGALIDYQGEVIGINTAIYSKAGGSIGLGFAVPSNIVKKVAEQAKQGAKVVSWPWLGIQMQEIDHNLFKALELKKYSQSFNQGAIITTIHPQSPAKKQNLKVGDIVLKFNGKIIKGLSDFRSKLFENNINETIILEIIRNKKKITKKIKAIYPNVKNFLLTVDNPKHLLDGLVIAEINEIVKRNFNVPENINQGILIVKVSKYAMLNNIGIKQNDIIIKVNGKYTNHPDDITLITKAKNRQINMQIIRNNRVNNIKFNIR